MVVTLPRPQVGPGPTSAGNLAIPSGVACTLEHGQHGGNVLVRLGGPPHLTDVTVGGNVRGERPSAVLVERSPFAGNLQGESGGAVVVGRSRGGIEITRNAIDGEMRCDGNGGTLVVDGNTVTGDTDLACVGG